MNPTKLFGAAGTGARFRNALIANGKEISFRLPTDHEWLAYERRVRRVAGYASAAEEAQGLALEFFDSLAIEAANLDAAEADHVLGRLEVVRIEDIGVDGDELNVRARAFAGVEVSARMRVQGFIGALQAMRHESQSRSDSLTPARAKFFDALVAPGSIKGYVGAPPIFHKAALARAVEIFMDDYIRENESAEFLPSESATEGQ